MTGRPWLPLVLVMCPHLVACSSEVHAPNGDVYLGPEAVETVHLERPNSLFRIGEPDGPESLEQGDAVTAAPVPDGGFLLFTAVFSSGPVLHFGETGRLRRTFGRSGQGPGEYTRVAGLAVEPETGVTWVLDVAGRLVSYDADGRPGAMVSFRELGASVASLTALGDGSLVVNAPGGVASNFGWLIHRYHPGEDGWSHHHPVLRDSVFDATIGRTWLRTLAVAPDGMVAAVSQEYEIELLDPERDFALVTTIRRRPPGWPEEVLRDNERRREEDRISPPFHVTDAWFDEEGRLWVLSGMPAEDWEEGVGPDPDRPWQTRSLVPMLDRGLDSLVEVFDVAPPRVVASYRLDQWARAFVGPGRLIHYLGDLPHPQFEILQLPHPEQQDPP